MPKERMTCGWCGENLATADSKVKRFSNDYGNLVEMRCPKCDKVLAAYLEGEGNFLAGMRNFPVN